MEWYHVFGLCNYSSDWLKSENPPELDDSAEAAREYGEIIRKLVSQAIDQDDPDVLKSILSEIDDAACELSNMTSENYDKVSAYYDTLNTHAENSTWQGMKAFHYASRLSSVIRDLGITEDIDSVYDVPEPATFKIPGATRGHITYLVNNLEESLENFKTEELLYKVLEKWDWEKNILEVLKASVDDQLIELDTGNAMYVFNNLKYYTACGSNGVEMSVGGDHICFKKDRKSINIGARGSVVIKSGTNKGAHYNFHDLMERYMNPLKPLPEEALVHSMSDPKGYDYETVNYLLSGFRKPEDIL